MIMRMCAFGLLLQTVAALAMDTKKITDTLAPVTPTNSVITTTTHQTADQAMVKILHERRAKFILRPLWQIFKKCAREKELLRRIDTTPIEDYTTLKPLIGKYKSVKRQIVDLIDHHNNLMGWEKPFFGSETFPKYDPRKTQEKPTDWLKKLSDPQVDLISKKLEVPEDIDC